MDFLAFNEVQCLLQRNVVEVLCHQFTLFGLKFGAADGNQTRVTGLESNLGLKPSAQPLSHGRIVLQMCYPTPSILST